MMRQFFGTAAAIALLAMGASAQELEPAQMKAKLDALLEKGRVIGATGGIMGKVVKGAPYSAVETNESTQTLADGTRIRNETTANVYRDSEGRVRREVGDHVTIWDPVANVSYTLDTKNMRAFKSSMAAPVFLRQSTMGAGGGFGAVGHAVGGAPTAGALVGESMSYVTVKDGMVTVQDGQTHTFPMPANGEWTSEDGKMHAIVRKTEGGPGGGTVSNFMVREGEMTITKDGKTTSMPPPQAEMVDHVFMAGIPAEAGPAKMMVRRVDPGKEEALGEQMMEGVKSTGTRNTATIEAGAIGNDRPISTVTERWYSSELQTEVMTKRSDPRMGESVFKLTNINRSEPAAYLFQVPSGYNLNERR